MSDSNHSALDKPGIGNKDAAPKSAEPGTLKSPSVSSTSKAKTPEMKPEDPLAKGSPEYDNCVVWAGKFYAQKVNVRKLYREFVALKAASKTDSAVNDKNIDKCRYADIPCVENTRVVLQNRPPDNDFIHANWMTMPDGYRYISTQVGPLEETMEDFWHMVYTEKSTNILMICDFVEGTLRKCSQYIPTDKSETKTCGIYKVKRIGKIVKDIEDVKHQVFEVSCKISEGKQVVNHYQYTNWPDHIAPKSPASVIKLYKTFRNPSNTSPVIVHCSAGIGRTATFVGVDYGFQKIQKNPDVVMLDLVREMRKMRDKAVQTHHQFVFLIICITEAIIMTGVPRNEHMTALIDFYKVRVDKNMKKKKDAKEKSIENDAK